MSNLIQKRLWLSPRDDQVQHRGDNADQQPVEYEMRIRTPADPDGKDQRECQRGDKNRRQEGLLPKEMEHRKNNRKDPQLR